MRVFAHFTSEAHAQAIVASGVLNPCEYLAAWSEAAQDHTAGIVYAVEIGVSTRVDSVQRHHSGRVQNGRDWAVVFTVERAPDEVSKWGEEVEWHTATMTAPLALTDACVMLADDVSATLR